MKRLIVLMLMLVLSGQEVVFAKGAVVQNRRKKELMMMKQQKAVMQKKAVMEYQKQQALQKNIQVKQQAMGNQNIPPEEITEVDFIDLWKALEKSSEVWNQIIDRQVKQYVVVELIKSYKKDGVFIRKAPSYYVTLIDEIAVRSPALLSNSFDRVLQFIAIMEYDFDNGEDKDALARRLLAPEAYRKNRERLGIN